MENQKANIPEFDNFISDVRPNANQVEKLSMINGYIGESSLDEHFRVYFDVELNNFIEIPNDSVLKCEKRPKENFPLGGSYIWIKSDSVFTYGNPKHYNRPKSTFLEGNLFDTYSNRNGYNMNQFRNSNKEIPIYRETIAAFCATGYVMCPTDNPDYPNPGGFNNNNQNLNASRLGFCPSHVDACPSALAWCNNFTDDIRVTRNQGCPGPSLVDGCGPFDFGFRGRFNPYQR